MQLIRNNILAVAFLLALSMAEENEEKQTQDVKAKDWYTEWVRSQENPYIMQRIKELGKKISLARGWESDTEPRGWFLEFQDEPVRGQLAVEARAARTQG